MPKVPMQTAQMISMDVPAPPQAAAVGAATGQSLENIGAAANAIGFQMETQVAESEARQQVQTRAAQSKYETEDKWTELKTLYPDGYVVDENRNRIKDTVTGKDRTIVHEFRDWVSPRFKEEQMGMNSRIAQEAYQQEMGAYYNGKILGAANDLSVMRADAITTESKSRNVLHFNRLMDAPIISSMYEALDTERLTNDENRMKKDANGLSGVLSGPQHKSVQDDIDLKVPAGVVRGLIEIAESGEKGGKSRTQAVSEARALLHGTDPESIARKREGKPIVAEILPYDVKADWLRMLDRLKGEAEAFDYADFARTAKDDEISRSTGGANSTRLPVLMGQLKNYGTTQAERDKNTRLVARTWMRGNLADAAGQTAQRMRRANPSSWAGIQAGYDGTIKSFLQINSQKNPVYANLSQDPASFAADKDEFRRELKATGERIIAERQEDSAAYVYKEFNSIGAMARSTGRARMGKEQLVDKLLQKYAELGIGTQYQRPISKQESWEFSRGLKSKDPNIVLQTNNLMRAQYGQHFDKVYEQVVADDGLAGREGLGMLGVVDDQISQESIVTNVLNKPAITTSYEQKFVDPSERKSHNATIEQELAPYFQGIAGNSSQGATLNFQNAVREQVTLAFQKAMATDANMTVDKAIKQAKKVFDSTHGTAVAGQSTVVYRRRINGKDIDEKILASYVGTHTSPEALATMDIGVPTILAGDPAYGQLSREEKRKKFFYAIQETGRFVTDATFSKLYLTITDNEGTTRYVKNSKGEFWSKPVQDTQTVNDPFTTEGLKSPYRKIKDAIFNRPKTPGESTLDRKPQGRNPAMARTKGYLPDGAGFDEMEITPEQATIGRSSISAPKDFNEVMHGVKAPKIESLPSMDLEFRAKYLRQFITRSENPQGALTNEKTLKAHREMAEKELEQIEAELKKRSK